MGDQGVYEHESETFAQFLYNKKDGTVMGRTGGSWARIGVFYLIFYTFLAGWFSVMLAVFWTTLDPQTNPTYMPGNKDGTVGGSLLQNPAMGYMPKPRSKNVESTLIWYRRADTKDVDYWSSYLDKFINSTYERKASNTDGQTLINCDKANQPGENQACIFDYLKLGKQCQKKDSFGYALGKPCVLIKMNKMINWRPQVYETMDDVPASMPYDLKKVINDTANAGEIPRRVWVSCEGENPADKEYIGKIDYFPHNGFDEWFFPYRNQPGYMNPLVAVVFQDPTPHVLINIRCTAWAKNIKREHGQRLGIVHFELLLD